MNPSHIASTSEMVMGGSSSMLASSTSLGHPMRDTEMMMSHSLPDGHTVLQEPMTRDLSMMDSQPCDQTPMPSGITEPSMYACLLITVIQICISAPDFKHNFWNRLQLSYPWLCFQFVPSSRSPTSRWRTPTVLGRRLCHAKFAETKLQAIIMALLPVRVAR